MAEGYRIGDSETSEANSAAAQAAAGGRAQQEIQQRQQQLEAAATQAAQKYQAQQGYQQALASGMDPVQAILKFGPGMGQGADVAAAIHAQPRPPMPAPVWNAANPATGQPGYFAEGGKAMVPRAVAQPQPKTVPGGSEWVPEDKQAGIPAHWSAPEKQQPDISPSELAQTLKALNDEQKEILDEDPSLMTKAQRSPDKLTPDEKQALGRLQSIEQQRKDLLPRLGASANVPQGAATPAAGGLKFVRDPQTGVLVQAGAKPAAIPPGTPQPAAPAIAAQPAAAKPPSILDQLGLPPIRDAEMQKEVAQFGQSTTAQAAKSAAETSVLKSNLATAKKLYKELKTGSDKLSVEDQMKKRQKLESLLGGQPPEAIRELMAQ